MSLVYCTPVVQGEYWRYAPGPAATLSLLRAVPLVYTVPTGSPPAGETLAANLGATVQGTGAATFDSTISEWLVIVVVGTKTVQLVPFASFGNLDGLYPTGFYAIWGWVLPDRVQAYQQA